MRLPESPEARARHVFQVQRNPGELARPLRVPRLAPPVARDVAPRANETNWGVDHVALARLRKLLDLARRPKRAVRQRRPLRQRHVHQRVGPRALRLTFLAGRQMSVS